MKTHLIVPARYKSTRLPAKPLLPIHNRPMILWTAERAQKAVADGVADDYWVATDDDRIFAVCQDNGVPVLMTNQNHPSGTDRLGEVASLLNFTDDDIVINLQGDEPLVPSNLLAQLKNLLLANDDCSMATLCERIQSYDEFVANSVVKVVFAKQKALYFSRSPIPLNRDNPNDFANAYRHLGLYAYRAGLLKTFSTWQMGNLERLESLEQLRILENGHRIAIDLASTHLPVGVDTQADLDRLNQMPIDRLLAMNGLSA